MRRPFVCILLLLGMMMVSIPCFASSVTAQPERETIQSTLSWPDGSTLVEVMSHASPSYLFLRKLDPNGNVLWENRTLGLTSPQVIYRMGLLTNGSIWLVAQKPIANSMPEMQFTSLSPDGAVEQSFALPDQTEDVHFNWDHLFTVGKYKYMDRDAKPTDKGIDMYMCAISGTGELLWMSSMQHITQLNLVKEPYYTLNPSDNGVLLHIWPNPSLPRNYLFSIDFSGQPTLMKLFGAEDEMFTLVTGDCLAITQLPDADDSLPTHSIEYIFSDGTTKYSHTLQIEPYASMYASAADGDGGYWVIGMMEEDKISSYQGISPALDAILSAPIFVHFDSNGNILYKGRVEGMDVIPFSLFFIFRENGEHMIRYQTAAKDGTFSDNVIPMDTLLEDATDIEMPWTWLLKDEQPKKQMR